MNNDRVPCPETGIDNQMSRCWAEIDLSAFRRNLDRLQKHIGGDTKILLPVKADAYGHGITEITKEASSFGVSYFGVASLEEALSVREVSRNVDILFLTPPLEEQIPRLLDADITPVLTTAATARMLGDLARSRGREASVHVEVDTGMGRTGIPWSSAADEIVRISGSEGIKLEGIMTHFSKADDRSPAFTTEQIDRFRGVLSQLPPDLMAGVILHASNSAASMRFPQARFTMIRPGLYPYGVSPLSWAGEGVDEPDPVLSLRARVILVKEVRRGDRISYGGRWTAPDARRIATVSAGYRDGVAYTLTNGGRVLIRGKSYPIIGSICMDMFMVDLADDVQVKRGDVVTIIGEDRGQRIDAKEIAEIAATIPYDILCSTGMRVPRVYQKYNRVIHVVCAGGTDRQEACTNVYKSDGKREGENQ